MIVFILSRNGHLKLTRNNKKKKFKSSRIRDQKVRVEVYYCPINFQVQEAGKFAIFTFEYISSNRFQHL